jgi:hypothetical protein
MKVKLALALELTTDQLRSVLAALPAAALPADHPDQPPLFPPPQPRILPTDPPQQEGVQ